MKKNKINKSILYGGVAIAVSGAGFLAYKNFSKTVPNNLLGFRTVEIEQVSFKESDFNDMDSESMIFDQIAQKIDSEEEIIYNQLGC
jgi:hypothetical protein